MAMVVMAMAMEAVVWDMYYLVLDFLGSAHNNCIIFH